jgi:hypothetical protein
LDQYGNGTAFTFCWPELPAMNARESCRVQFWNGLSNLRMGDLSRFANEYFDQNCASDSLPEGGWRVLGANSLRDRRRVEVLMGTQVTESPGASVSDLLGRILEQVFERRNQILLGLGHPR